MKVRERTGDYTMADKKPQHVEYMCAYCGNKYVRQINTGKPLLGTCPKRNGKQPHSWRINRKF